MLLMCEPVKMPESLAVRPKKLACKAFKAYNLKSATLKDLLR